MIELGACNSAMRPSEQSVAACSRHVTAAALKHNLVQLVATLIYIFLASTPQPVKFVSLVGTRSLL